MALPVALDSGQIIQQYNNLTVTSSGILHPANRCNGMILLVKGDLTVDGTIHVDKCAPLLNESETLAAQEQHVALCGVTAGGKGGNSGAGITSWNSLPHADGAARLGGNGFAFGGGMGAGSDGLYYGGVDVQGGPGDPRPPAGTTIPYVPDASNPAKYGAGGGGSGTYIPGGAGPGGSGGVMWSSGSGYAGNAGDAIGGGAIWIFAQGKVRINGTGKIHASGGNGANGRASVGNARNIILSGGGGGGGGGIICLVHTGDIINSGDVVATGGAGGGVATVDDYSSNPGSNGFAGTVLITEIADLLAARAQQAFTALNILGVQT